MKQLLNKLSILIPLSLISVLYMEPMTIAIPQLGIYLSYGMSTLLVVMVTMLWLCCSPWKKSCCNGTWTETLFNAVPLGLSSLLDFAQWCFWGAVIIFVLMLAVGVGFKLYLHRDEQKQEYSEKLHRRYRLLFDRCFVLVLAALCIVPFCMSAFVYDHQSPTYYPEAETLDQFMEDATVAGGENSGLDLYQENIYFLNCFREERWQNFSIYEKISIMQGLVDLEAKNLGMPSVPVIAELLAPLTLGQYGVETNEMSINTKYLGKATVEECVRTICHETFHAYQHFLINNLDWTNPVMDNAYFAELRAWNENDADYKDSWDDGFDAYEDQPLEVSARQYAEEETQKILLYASYDYDAEEQ